jgi:15-cis-phytoene synthase
MDLYTRNALKISKTTTRSYSTSFSLGVMMLEKQLRPAIYAIYGFVRFADEIVDTFHLQDQKTLLSKFKQDTWSAIENRFSTNPILHSFQWAVNEYNIEYKHIEAFIYSMELDLYKNSYNRHEYQVYIYGSAEVIGLMCLRVFYYKDDETYEKLKYPARKLGEAFQKVNFLRDMLSDYHERGRIYFPGIKFENFTPQVKAEIEKEIAFDFEESYQGIKLLRKDVRLGVYLAYKYYLNLLAKIKKAQPDNLLEKRFRINNGRKVLLLGQCYLQNSLNVV